MELFPRIKRIAITNTIDKEFHVQTNLQVVLEMAFSEELGRGFAAIARSDDLKCEIYELQRRLALNGSSTDPQPQASRDLFTPPAMSEIDMLKARVTELWTKYLGTPEDEPEKRIELNDQTAACEMRLLALGIYVELDESGSDRKPVIEFANATDDELIDADSDFRSRLSLGDLEPTKKLAFERNLEDLAKTLAARGWEPVVEEEDGETNVGWVRKPAEELEDDVAAACYGLQDVKRLQAEYERLNGEDLTAEVQNRLTEIEARLDELGVDVTFDGVGAVVFLDVPTEDLVEAYWDAMKLAEDPEGSQMQVELAGLRLVELAEILTARGWVLVDNTCIDPNYPEPPKIWTTKEDADAVAANIARQEEQEAASPPKKSRSKKATKKAA